MQRYVLGRLSTIALQTISYPNTPLQILGRKPFGGENGRPRLSARIIEITLRSSIAATHITRADRHAVLHALIVSTDRFMIS